MVGGSDREGDGLGDPRGKLPEPTPDRPTGTANPPGGRGAGTALVPPWDGVLVPEPMRAGDTVDDDEPPGRPGCMGDAERELGLDPVCESNDGGGRGGSNRAPGAGVAPAVASCASACCWRVYMSNCA